MDKPILMLLVKRKVKDRRVLKLNDRYLKVGMFAGGIVSPRQEGTPQGALSKAFDKPPYQK